VRNLMYSNRLLRK